MNIYWCECHPNTVNVEECWVTYRPQVGTKKQKTCKPVKWNFCSVPKKKRLAEILKESNIICLKLWSLWRVFLWSQVKNLYRDIDDPAWGYGCSFLVPSCKFRDGNSGHIRFLPLSFRFIIPRLLYRSVIYIVIHRQHL